MSAQPVESITHLPHGHLEPLDPASAAGKAASAVLAELFDDVAERLRREGKPVPDCIA
jgi:hypothetical protein